MEKKIFIQSALWLMLFLSSNCFGQNKWTRLYRDIKIESEYIRNCEAGKGICLRIQVKRAKNEGIKLGFPVCGTESDVFDFEHNHVHNLRKI